MQDVSSLGKKRSLEPPGFRQDRVGVLQEIKCNSDRERAALGWGSAEQGVWENDGFALENPSWHCESSLGSASPEVKHVHDGFTWFEPHEEPSGVV